MSEKMPLEMAVSLYSEDMTEKELAELQKAYGSASSLYRPGWRLWNWLFDTEYVCYGPPPIAWFGLGALALVFLGLVALIVVL